MVLPAPEVIIVSLFIVSRTPAQLVTSGSKVTKVSLFTVFSPCPGGVHRPRSYQSVAIYYVLPPAQVMFPAFEVTKVSLFVVSPRRYLSCSRPCSGEVSRLPANMFGVDAGMMNLVSLIHEFVVQNVKVTSTIPSSTKWVCPRTVLFCSHALYLHVVRGNLTAAFVQLLAQCITVSISCGGLCSLACYVRC